MLVVREEVNLAVRLLRHVADGRQRALLRRARLGLGLWLGHGAFALLLYELGSLGEPTGEREQEVQSWDTQPCTLSTPRGRT